MKMQSKVKAGGNSSNHGQAAAGGQKKGLRVRAGIKAGPGGYGSGGVLMNHSQTLAR